LPRNGFRFLAVGKLTCSSPKQHHGEVRRCFNPDFYLIDRDQRVVRRKNSFERGDALFGELLVRDRRDTEEEIRTMCVTAGFEVI
jgi:hypothetical protein